jgi:hypothetical protein
MVVGEGVAEEISIKVVVVIEAVFSSSSSNKVFLHKSTNLDHNTGPQISKVPQIINTTVKITSSNSKLITTIKAAAVVDMEEILSVVAHECREAGIIGVNLMKTIIAVGEEDAEHLSFPSC